MTTISNDEILGRARDYFKVQLCKSLELALDLPGDPAIDLEFEIAGTEELEAHMRKALKRQVYPPSVQSDAAFLLDPIHPDSCLKASSAFKFACHAVQRAKIENTRILAAQLRGNYHDIAPRDPWFSGLHAIDLPPLPGEVANVASEGPTFEAVAKKFYDSKSQNDWVAKTAADFKRVIALAIQLIEPKKPMQALSLDDVKIIRDALASVPPNYMKMAANKGVSIQEAVASNQSGPSLSIKTQDKYFKMFKGILLWSTDEGYLDKVPGSGVKVAGLKTIVAGEQRDPYSPDQLSKIFKSPVFTGCASENCLHKSGAVQVRNGHFWIPLIALFSGMRSGEIIQLLRSDVKEEGGIWYFDLNKDGGKNLKTASSKRRVPIHSVLLDLGFLAVIKSQPLAERIFSEIKMGVHGDPSHYFSKWWSKYAGHVGFKTPKTTFHSFRHNFLDALRAAEHPEYVNKALMGHSDKAVHSQYGSGVKLNSLKSAIDKVNYCVQLPGFQGAIIDHTN